MNDQDKNTTSTPTTETGSGDQKNQPSTGSGTASAASDNQSSTGSNSANAAGSASDTASKTDSGSTSESASSNASGASSTTASSAAETVKSTAQDVLAKAKDSAGQAYGFAAEKATSKIEEQKAVLSSGLSGVADSIRQVGKTFGENEEPNVVTDLTAKYGETLAGQIENLSGYFDEKDLREIIGDVEDFARRQPVVFIGAAFAAGLLLARFLKSSSDGGGSALPRSSRQLAGGSGVSSKKRTQSNGQTAVNPS